MKDTLKTAGTAWLWIVCCILINQAFGQTNASTSGSPAERIDPPAPNSSDWGNFSKDIWFEGSLYDYVIFLASKFGWGVSIDPSVAGKLIEHTTFIRNKPNQGLGGHLTELLATNRFIIKKTTLCNRQLSFITTTERWNYYIVLSYLQSGKIHLARQGMVAARNEPRDSEAALLLELSDVFQKNEQTLRGIESKIKASLTAYNKRLNDYRVVQSSAEMTFTRSGSDHFRAIAKNEYEKAWAEFTKANSAYEQLCTEYVPGNEKILKQFRRALICKNTYEALYILDRVITDFNRLKAQHATIAQAQAASATVGSSSSRGGFSSRGTHSRQGEVDYFKMNEGINDLLAELRGKYAAALGKQKEGLNKLASANDYSNEDLEDSLVLDASLFGANVGCGYLNVLQSLSSLKRILLQPVTTRDDLAVEFRRGQKGFRLQSLRGISPLNYEPEVLETGIKGIAVSDGKASIFPIIVQIEPRPASVTTITRTSYSPYWGAIYRDDAEVITDTAPIFFSDYGEKDILLRIMAQQSYDWLVSQDTNNELNKKRLRIGFHEVFSSKGGDSASAAMAVAGYSALFKKPIRQDVAITGSIRADGAIKAVGGVASKVSGAMSSPGIEIICVPYENISDLCSMSMEQLCKSTIVTAKNVKTYLKYCLWTDESKLLNSMLGNLQEAQQYLLLGDKAKAYGLLKSIASQYPEVYSASRLLELLERFGKEKEFKVKHWGDPI